MSDTKHTPGPWHYPGTGNFVGGPDRVRVADLGGLERTPDERQANAHLIAAAPALLGALEQAIRWSKWELSGPTDARAAEDGEPAWVCNARAAIAAARG